MSQAAAVPAPVDLRPAEIACDFCTVPKLQQRLGPRQRELLAFIRGYMVSNGYAPSIRDCQRALGLRSHSTAVAHLAKLEDAGAITIARGVARGIVLTERLQ